jgi:hypothetical protein
VNNRPCNLWLYTTCRRYVDADDEDNETLAAAEVEVRGDYDGNPTGA